jgi:RHS repeat-associated protein
VVAVSNSSGGSDGTTRFDAWGNSLASTGATPLYGYAGREPDETGLIYCRARYYDPAVGRFTQRDPTGLRGGINQFAYVGGNPVNRVDPSGTIYRPIVPNAATAQIGYTGQTAGGLTSGTQNLGIQGNSGISESATDQSRLNSNGFTDLTKQVQNADFSTPKDGAVFWTGFRQGNQSAAMNWAEANNKFTIEMTIGGKWLNSLKLYDKNTPVTINEADALWQVASEKFAGSASGRVNAFTRGTFTNSDSVFYNIELPILKDNPNVSPIFTYRGY